MSETYSVSCFCPQFLQTNLTRVSPRAACTRLGAPHLPHTASMRVLPCFMVSALRSTFPGPLFGLMPEHYLELVDGAPELGIVGGAIFDAVIATAAARASLKLVSRDQRATATYAALGVEFEVLRSPAL